MDFIRSHADKKEHAINDLVDSLFDQTYTLPDSLIGIVKNIALIGKSYRDRRKRREALRRVVVSLLEQVFDPVLQFRMQYKDILDTFQANDIDRDSVSHDQVQTIYVKVLNQLKAGELRDVLRTDEVLLFYTTTKIRDITYSRQHWEMNYR